VPLPVPGNVAQAVRAARIEADGGDADPRRERMTAWIRAPIRRAESSGAHCNGSG